jgi:radical SAM-linked protein
LIKLRAEKPRERIERPPPVKVKRKGPPPRIEQGEARRYRFEFTKLGASAYLSHLDLIRALPRAFRRAGLPLFYTSGFHPKADMTFSPALSLGVMSLGEIVDVKLTCAGDPTTWLDALTQGAPDGLRFVSARALGPGDSAISKLIDTAQYALAIPRSAMSEDDMRSRIDAALRAETLVLTRTIEGIGKKVDVRKYMRALALDDPRATDAIARAGLVGDLAAVFVEIAVTPTGSAKISEAAEVVFGANTPVKAVRSALLEGVTSPARLIALSS